MIAVPPVITENPRNIPLYRYLFTRELHRIEEGKSNGLPNIFKGKKQEWIGEFMMEIERNSIDNRKRFELIKT